MQPMHLPTLLHVTLVLGMVHAFSGGWNGFAQSTRKQQHRQHSSSAGVGLFRRFDPGSLTPGAVPARAAPRLQQLRLMPNEYEAFFNKASKLGADATRNLAPEERAQRAMEGEKLEDDIIEIATVLREKADEMVEKTGAINFEVIQPMIDEIAVLKSKYKVVMGVSEEEAVDGASASSSPATDDNDEDTSSPP
eukprot:g7324.t1